MNKKNIFHKIPLFWKEIWFFIAGSLLVVGVMVYFYSNISTLLNNTPNINIDIINLISQQLVKLFVFSIIVWLIVILMIYLDFISFIKRLNGSLKNALAERDLASNFQNYYAGKTFEDITTNIQYIFSLLNSFDNMKASRISAEVNSLKFLINNIDEGVIFVNKELIVTHVNHSAEIMLKLSPGEIIEQSISRKVSHEAILNNLEEALEKDKKITDLEFQVKDQKLSLNIFPIKNRAGDIFRALIILSTVVEEIVEEQPKIKTTTKQTSTK
jgi:PAS domain-containing protein